MFGPAWPRAKCELWGGGDCLYTPPSLSLSLPCRVALAKTSCVTSGACLVFPHACWLSTRLDQGILIQTTVKKIKKTTSGGSSLAETKRDSPFTIHNTLRYMCPKLTLGRALVLVCVGPAGIRDARAVAMACVRRCRGAAGRLAGPLID